jgi:hypothetical protein
MPSDICAPLIPFDSAKPAESDTGFARLSPWAARGVLILTALVIAWLVSVSLSPNAIDFAAHPRGGHTDIELYHAEIHRIRQSEGYYEAANLELRRLGYPVRSVFNWRTPLPMWLLGVLPSDVSGRTIIGLFAAMMMVMAIHAMGREAGPRVAILCGVLLIGALMPCWLKDTYVMPVVWAGVFMGLSICAYAIQRWGWGLAFGLTALFLRELAAPYCAIAIVLAARTRRWREVGLWMIGLLAYLGFYSWHYYQVTPLISPNDLAHAEGWLQFKGAPFVLAIAQMNIFCLLLPQWVTAIYLPLAMLGFASWNSPAGQRAGFSACAFVILFAFVGHPFNQYWGALVSPLLCLGAAQAPAAVLDLVRQSRGVAISLAVQ